MTDAQLRLSTALADRYRIERELGQGGMATVYLAHDLKHERKVAIKVLKPELAAVIGAERFVVEIRTTAALQHPHILPLFDSGSADGFLYYVMPFVDGETLRSKLDRERQLGVEEAVRIATDVADALHYAHEQGVIHRDIKPENILLHNGRPMVADFGIALALSAAAGGRMTETGLSLGTPHYMSPEQATAEKEISARSDVYSLASVLYEMLTGNPPHVGSTAQQIIMKIITETPQPVTQLRRSVPPNIAAAVAHALEKLPADRFESARAFAQALATSSYTGGTTRMPALRAATPRDWRSRAAIPALALSVMLLAVVLWGATGPSAPGVVSRYEVVRPIAGAAEYMSVVVSPDGSRIIIAPRVGTEAGMPLVVRHRDQIEPVELPGTEGAFNPSFSPDGQRLAFMMAGAIKVMDLAGGPTTTLADSGVGVPGVSWGADGYIYFDALGIGPLVRIPESGGARETVSTLDTASKELQHVFPDALPNGRGVIMTINRGGPAQGAAVGDGIAVLDLTTGKHRELFRGVFARYATSGHLLYVTREGTLMGVPFDQDRLTVTGTAVALAQGLSVSATGSGAVDLSISRTGTLWYTLGMQGIARREIGWTTRDGQYTPFDPAITGDIVDAELSPDGTRIAFIMRAEDGAHVWVSRVGSRNRARLTFERSYDEVGWHPDGTSLILTRAPGELQTVKADGSSLPMPVPGARGNARDARWSPDGTRLLFSSQGARTFDIFSTRPGTDSTNELLVSTEEMERVPSVSPDGRWLLFRASRAMSGVTLVRPFPNTTSALYQVSSGGGTHAIWSKDGRAIYYRSSEDSLMSVPVLPGTGFELGEARALFSVRDVFLWDAAPDDQRFLVVRSREDATPERLIVIENFHEELKAKVGR